MLNVAVQKEASKMLTVKDVCWAFILMDKTAKTVDCLCPPQVIWTILLLPLHALHHFTLFLCMQAVFLKSLTHPPLFH